MPSSLDSISQLLEEKYNGFKTCLGGEELNRAAASLSGAGTPLQIVLSQHQVGSQPPTVLPHNALPLVVEEVSPQVQELKYAAKQYSVKVASGKASFETCYSYALVLQELASRLTPGSAEQIQHLQQACRQYDAACTAKPNRFTSLYNWGVALSDLARALRPAAPTAASTALAAASHKYAAALAASPGNVQALNNWGLVLQELSADGRTTAEQDMLVHLSLDRFRSAIRLLPDFDRGVYNLGTVLYGRACEMQSAMSAGQAGFLEREHGWSRPTAEAMCRTLFSCAAQYVALAYTLQPSRDVYRKSLEVVREMLPLPYLRGGYLSTRSSTSSRSSGAAAAPETWRRGWFVLDHVSLREAGDLESSLSVAGTGRIGAMIPRMDPSISQEGPVVVPLGEVEQAERVNDPSLPEGEAFWLSFGPGRAPLYMLADDATSADAWVDAVLLTSHIVKTRGGETLAEALSLQPVKKRPTGRT